MEIADDRFHGTSLGVGRLCVVHDRLLGDDGVALHAVLLTVTA